MALVPNEDSSPSNKESRSVSSSPDVPSSVLLESPVPPVSSERSIKKSPELEDELDEDELLELELEVEEELEVEDVEDEVEVEDDDEVEVEVDVEEEVEEVEVDLLGSSTTCSSQPCILLPVVKIRTNTHAGNNLSLAEIAIFFLLSVWCSRILFLPVGNFPFFGCSAESLLYLL